MYYADWRKAENYEYTRNHTNRMWAWEFLRRNPKYNAFWKKCLDEYHAAYDRYIATGLTDEILTLSSIIVNRNDPDVSSDNPDFVVSSFFGYIVWGTCNIHNPIQDCPEEFSLCSDLLTCRHNEVEHLELEPDEVVIKIALSKPVSPQLEAYRDILLDEQQTNEDAIWFNQYLRRVPENNPGAIQIKKRGTVWQDYLRVLDADNEGYKPTKAAAIIFPKKVNQIEHYRNSLKRARKIMEGEYRKWL